MIQPRPQPGALAAMRTRMVVPLPAADSIWSVAPTSAARSCMPSSPNPRPPSPRPEVESDAIVLDDEQHVIGPPLEHDVDVLGARVLGDVVERFLRDAIERRFSVRRETIVQESGGVQLGGDADALRPVLNVVRQRRPQAEIVERGRPELPDEMIDVAVELLCDRFERVDLRAQFGAVAARVLEGLDPPSECRQLLAELVVHLARDSPALVFLREHQPGEQLRAGPVRPRPASAR